MPLSTGLRLGPYEVVAPLGAGGMGEVYRAQDTRLRRDVALKILPADVAADPARRARFEQEAHAAAALSHPNILSVYDVGDTDGVSYIASELLNGETLAAAIERGAMPVRALLDVAVQIADGLAAAHAAHIVHRDLKPANVMITAEGRVKILDFGLAKQTIPGASGDETFAQHTMPGMIVGTVSYMSPEQARGRAVDYRSDQFSFGLMLYEMATGRKAFDEPESVQTLSAIIANEPPPLEARLPAPLRWVIDRCLAKNPEHRYESSRDLFHEVRSLREHLSEISTQVGHQAVPAPAAKRARTWPVPAAFLLGLIVPVALALARMGPAQPAPSDYRFTPFSFEPGGQNAPVFATDGKAIAYAARQTLAEPFQVYVRYLDAPTGMQLTQVSTAHAYPIAWSPDSKRVLFVQAGEAPGIYSIPTAGGEPQLLITLPESSLDRIVPQGITVSTDNRFAAFLERSGDGTWGVSTVALPGGPTVKYPAAPFATKEVYNAPNLRFSPDGRQILLLLNRGPGEEGWLLKFPEEGAAGVRRIEPALKTYRGTPAPAWMPDNRHIVVSLQPTPDGSEQLWLVDTQSSERHALISSTRNAGNPSVAPGGDKLVFRETNGNFDVVSVDLATGAATTVVATERDELMPAWAAGEPTMVYSSNRNGPDAIWLRRSGIPDRPVVTVREFPADSTLRFMGPALSPRGDRVMYVRLERDAPAKLWISAVAGGAPIRATQDPKASAEFPGSWSPDGVWFVYSAVVDGNVNLMKVKTSGEATPVTIKTNLSDGSRQARSVPDWSPAGDWIVFGSLLISPDGKTERSLGSHGSPHYAFSTNGKLVYGMAPENGRHTLFSIDVATGAKRTIAPGITYAPLTNMTPSMRLSVAPDGKSLLYGTGVITNSLWILEGFNPPDSLLVRLGWRR